MCWGRDGKGGLMVVAYFDYSGTARKVIYYWEPIQNYLADFFPKFVSFVNLFSDKKIFLFKWVFMGPKPLFLAILNLFIALSSPFLTQVALFFTYKANIFRHYG